MSTVPTTATCDACGTAVTSAEVDFADEPTDLAAVPDKAAYHGSRPGRLRPCGHVSTVTFAARPVTTADHVAALDALDPEDPESAHDAADAVLLSAVPPDVAAAYRRLVERCDWWATACTTSRSTATARSTRPCATPRRRSLRSSRSSTGTSRDLCDPRRMAQPVEYQQPPLGYCVGCAADKAPLPVPANVTLRGTGLCWGHLDIALKYCGWWAAAR